MSDPTVIPNSIRRYLRSYVAQRRRVALVTSAARASGCAIAWLLLISLLDRLIPLPAALRLISLAIMFGIVAVLLFRPLRAMVMRRFDWRVAAAQVERRDLRFLGRLETAVSQLLLPPAIRGSDFLIDRIVTQASALAAESKARSLISVLPAIRAWLLVAAIAALGVSLTFVPWLDLRTLLRRQIEPLASIPAVTTTRLSVDPGNIDVAQGESCTISVRAARLSVSPPILHLDSNGKQISDNPMAAATDGKFSFTLPAIDRDWQYDITGGDARSQTYSIRVLRRPGIVQFRVRYVYPAYMDRAPRSVVSADGLLEAPVDTQAIVDLVCTEPVASATVIVNGRQIVARPTSDPNVYQATLTMSQSGPYQVRLLSQRGVLGVDPDNTVIRAQPDQLPRAEWLDGLTDLRLTPLDSPRLSYRISDDYSVASVALSIQINDSPPSRIPLPREWNAFTLTLGTWDVNVGDVVRVSIHAIDSKGQEAASDPISILVAPGSVGIDQQSSIRELEAAVRLAQSITDELAESVRNSRQSPSGAGVFGRNTHLSRSVDLADQLLAHLLRAAAGNRRADLAALLRDSLDRAAICRFTVHSGLEMDEQANPSARSQLIARADQTARSLRDQLRALVPGERARLIRTDLQNFQALLEREDALPPARAILVAEILNRAAHKLDDQIDALGIDPEDDRLLSLLEEKIAAADAMTEWLPEVDWAGTARQIGSAELSERLLVASRAGALDAQANFERARDLNLAAYAVLNWPPTQAGSFADTMMALQSPDHAQAARQLLRQQAGKNPETTAFESAADEHPIQIDPPATQPAQFSPRQQKLAAEIKAVQAATNASTLEAPDPTAVFVRLRAVEPLHSIPNLRGWVERCDRCVIDAAPLSAAKYFAKRASDELSQPHPNLNEIAVEQALAIAAANSAASGAARSQARMRIKSIPALARLLDDSAPTIAAPAFPATTRPTTTASDLAPAGSGPDGAFEEPTRIYFQLLRQAR